MSWISSILPLWYYNTEKKQQTLLEKSGTIVSNMAIELQMDYIFLYRELVFDKILFCNITFFNLTFVHLYFGHI